MEFVRQGGAQLTQLLGVLSFTVPGVLIGGQIGPMVSERIPDRWLEIGMGVLFLLVALLMLGDVAVF